MTFESMEQEQSKRDKQGVGIEGLGVEVTGESLGYKMLFGGRVPECAACMHEA